MNYFFPQEDENTRWVYDYRFQWTKNHRTSEELAAMKFTYDKLADEVLERLNAIPLESTADDGKPPERDLLALLKENADKDEKLAEFWDQVNTVPAWVDWDQIERGQEVFWRYSLPLLTGFLFHAFFGINGSSSRAAEVLVRTGGHSAKVMRQRFFETFQMLMQTSRSIDAVKPGGEGHAAMIRVRFLHAAVRCRLLKLADTRPSYFNVEQNGIPINDLDIMQGLFEFSLNHARISMPRLGVYMREQEELDFLAMWRWNCSVMGVNTDHLKTPQIAMAAMESVYLESTGPTKASRSLVESALQALEGMAPVYATRGFWEVGTRWIMGPKLSDALALGRPSPYYWVVFAGLSWGYMLEVYVSRNIPSLDRKKIALFREVFWTYVIEDKKEGLGKKTDFAFKYVPQVEGIPNVDEPAPQIGSKVVGVEELGLIFFFIACVSTIAAGLVGYIVIHRGLGAVRTLLRV